MCYYYTVKIYNINLKIIFLNKYIMETNKNNKNNDNIDDNTDIYLDVTDEEFLYIINLNLPSF